MLLALMLAACTACGGDADTTRYRVEFTDSEVLRASAVGDSDRPGNASGTLWISVVMRDTVDARVARIIVDSLDVIATGTSLKDLTPDALAQARGGVIEEIVGSGRTQKSLVPPATSAIGLARHAMLALFPGRYPPLSAGVTWADTSSLDEVGGELTTSGQSIQAWTVTAGAGNELVLRAEGHGTMTRAQAAMKMRVTSTMRMVRTIAMVPGEMTSNGSAEVNVESEVVTAALPVPLPITQKITVRAMRTP